MTISGKPRKISRSFLLAGVALAGGLAAAAQVVSPALADMPQAAPGTAAVADAARLGEAFASVASTVSPAVVSIRVEARQQRQELPFEIFGLPRGGQGDGGIAVGGGSGVIVSRDGHILTNNHVVGDALRIDVRLSDGRAFEGRVVGTDPATDLAVVKIDARDLPIARIGASDATRVGEFVVAIGSPFGLDYTVTTGVLSARGRGGMGMNEIEDYLQTDASINPGNSGGPLVNLRGEVIGINTMIIGRGSGIGFAIPSELAQTVAQQLIASGTVRRAWLGVGFQEMTPELAAHFEGAGRAGALINHVAPDGPAARAGIHVGDVVVAVDGQPVREGRDLLRTVLRKSVGSTVRLDVVRDGRHLDLTLRTAERPGARTEQRAASARAPERQAQSSRGYGLSLAPITAQIRQRIGYEGRGKVVVSGVAPGSAADRAGLRTGDVVVEADRNPVDAGPDLERALNDGSALLRVERRDGAFFTLLRRDPERR